jgi:hypothetical protein
MAVLSAACIEERGERFLGLLFICHTLGFLAGPLAEVGSYALHTLERLFRM